MSCHASYVMLVRQQFYRVAQKVSHYEIIKNCVKSCWSLSKKE